MLNLDVDIAAVTETFLNSNVASTNPMSITEADQGLLFPSLSKKLKLKYETRKGYRASVAQCKVSAYAPSCRRCVATYWKEQTRR